jgi:hypothetical protein
MIWMTMASSSLSQINDDAGKIYDLPTVIHSVVNFLASCPSPITWFGTAVGETLIMR